MSNNRQQMIQAAVCVNTALNAADCFGLLPVRGKSLNISGSASIDGQVAAPKLYGCIQTATDTNTQTVGESTTLLLVGAVSQASTITLPKAEAGRHFKALVNANIAANSVIFATNGTDTLAGAVHNEYRCSRWDSNG